MGAMIACHGHTNPVYSAHKTVGASHTRKYIIHSKNKSVFLTLIIRHEVPTFLKQYMKHYPIHYAKCSFGNGLPTRYLSH